MARLGARRAPEGEQGSHQHPMVRHVSAENPVRAGDLGLATPLRTQL
jgi:hypothetical protein